MLGTMQELAKCYKLAPSVPVRVGWGSDHSASRGCILAQSKYQRPIQFLTFPQGAQMKELHFSGGNS